MKVLFLTPDYPPDVAGGIGPYTKEMARALTERGHEVHVLACRQGAHDANEMDGRVSVHRRGWREPGRRGALTRAPQASLRLRNAWEVGRHVRRLGPFDVIEAPDWKAFALMIPKSIPVVLHLHMPFRAQAAHQQQVTAWDTRCADLLERRATQRAMVVTAPSQLVVDTAEQGGWKVDQAEIIRHPIAPQKARTTPASSTPPVIVCIGRLEPRKGPDLLIRAASEITPDLPEVEITFVGGATDDELGRGFLSYLQGLAESLHVRCNFVSHQRHDELAPWYRSARVVAIPSRFDNFPMTGLEALAAARPLVLTRDVGLAEVIEGTGAGSVATTRDPSAIARAMRPYLVDADLARRAGERAAALALREFGPAKIALQREEIFERARQGMARSTS